MMKASALGAAGVFLLTSFSGAAVAANNSFRARGR